MMAGHSDDCLRPISSVAHGDRLPARTGNNSGLRLSDHRAIAGVRLGMRPTGPAPAHVAVGLYHGRPFQAPCVDTVSEFVRFAGVTTGTTVFRGIVATFVAMVFGWAWGGSLFSTREFETRRAGPSFSTSDSAQVHLLAPDPGSKVDATAARPAARTLLTFTGLETPGRVFQSCLFSVLKRSAHVVPLRRPLLVGTVELRI